MLERNILIVDDNMRIRSIYIPAYLDKIEKLKQGSTKWKNYHFNLVHKISMKEALEYLSDNTSYVDVLVVDYDFGGENTFTSGTSFIKCIREKINRYCQIVFYTMQGLGSIEKEELVELVNSDVFKIVDKCDDTSVMAETLFEAATRRNPIVESLEKFLIKYRTLLKTYKYTLNGKDISYEEIINHIRMDDEIGRVFVDKLLQKAILIDTDIEA